MGRAPYYRPACRAPELEIEARRGTRARFRLLHVPRPPLMPSPDLTREIKTLLVSELNLAGKDPGSIQDEAPLFGEGGLGLDSLDALQIAMFVEERFGVRVPDGDE